MVDEQVYEIRIIAHDDAPVGEFLRDALEQLDAVSGIIDVSTERVDTEDRDISEVYRILGDLSKHELESLEDAIETYTEDEE